MYLLIGNIVKETNMKTFKEFLNERKSVEEVNPANGDTEYRNVKGQLHRLDGPAVIRRTGGENWYKNGKLHREGGPAIQHANGDKIWWVNGKLHRLDGPAVEYANGDKEYWVKGKQLSSDEFNAKYN